MIVADRDPDAAGSIGFVRSEAGSAEIAPRVTWTQPFVADEPAARRVVELGIDRGQDAAGIPRSAPGSSASRTGPRSLVKLMRRPLG